MNKVVKGGNVPDANGELPDLGDAPPGSFALTIPGRIMVLHASDEEEVSSAKVSATVNMTDFNPRYTECRVGSKNFRSARNVQNSPKYPYSL